MLIASPMSVTKAATAVNIPEMSVCLALDENERTSAKNVRAASVWPKYKGVRQSISNRLAGL